MNTPGERIKFIREQLGVSQARFGGAIGQDRLVIARWESGEQKPRSVQLKALAQLLNLPIEWVLEGHGLPPEIDQATEDTLREMREKAKIGLGVPSVRMKRERKDPDPLLRFPEHPQLPAAESLLLSISARIAALMSDKPNWPSIPGISHEMMMAFAKQRAIPSMRMIAAFAESFGVEEEMLLYGKNHATGRGARRVGDTAEPGTPDPPEGL